MPARDSIHDNVRRALERDGWTFAATFGAGSSRVHASIVVEGGRVGEVGGAPHSRVVAERPPRPAHEPGVLEERHDEPRLSRAPGHSLASERSSSER